MRFCCLEQNLHPPFGKWKVLMIKTHYDCKYRCMDRHRRAIQAKRSLGPICRPSVASLLVFSVQCSEDESVRSCSLCARMRGSSVVIYSRFYFSFIHTINNACEAVIKFK
jgi:hypothetical protein